MGEASFDLGGALQAVVENLNRFLMDDAGKVKAEIDQACKRVLSLFDRVYASAVGSICPIVMRDNDELLRSFPRCAVLVSTCFDKIDGVRLVAGKPATKKRCV